MHVFNAELGLMLTLELAVLAVKVFALSTA